MSVAETPRERPSPRYGEGRLALLGATVQVVADQGLRNLTYRAVAREAGMSHGSVDHHFGSRDALLEEALRYSLNRTVTSISTRPGSGDLDAVFEGLCAMVEDNPADQAFQYELILEGRRRPELRPHVEAIYQAYVTGIQRELECAGLEHDIALGHLVYAAADGLVFNQITIGNADMTERALAHLRELLASAKVSTDPPRTSD
ncbi:TetR/AcrR family transcriptional regulator [Rhodococcus sp. NPDC078407]|uniref:TetR/AcrR family transcriptional regulator n=1 Tax=Rhodococcus sp. NPDC078407 TaxID=3364509 RepID=UPI0037C5DC2E